MDLKIKYCVTLEENRSAFILFQKKYVFPKNIIMTIGFAIIFAVYVYLVMKEPTNNFYWLLVGMSGVFGIMVWVNSFMIRRNLLKSLATLRDDTYETTFYEDKISIQNVTELVDEETGENIEIKPTEIMLADGVQITEADDLFLIYLKRSKIFYVIPKKNITADELPQVRKALHI